MIGPATRLPIALMPRTLMADVAWLMSAGRSRWLMTSLVTRSVTAVRTAGSVASGAIVATKRSVFSSSPRA